MAVVSGANGVYFAGGIATLPPNVVDGKHEVYLYTPSNGFTLITSLYEGSTHPRGLKVGSKIMFVVGTKQFDLNQSNPYTISDKVYVYDESTMQWDSATLSLPRFDVAVATDGNIAIFAGGQTGSGSSDVSNVVDIYNNTTGQWSMSALSTARTGAAAAYLNGKFYVAGGATGTLTNTPTVEIFDPVDGTWESGGDLSNGRWGMQACACGDDIIFAQGSEINFANYYRSPIYDAVDFYHTASQTWTQHNLSKRVDHTAITVDNYAIVAGGSGDFDPSDQVAIWNCSLTSLDFQEWQPALTVSPIPFTDEIWLNLEIDHPGDFLISVTDLYGRQLIHCHSVLQTGTNSIELDCSELSSGIYFVNVRSGQGAVTRKIVKQ